MPVNYEDIDSEFVVMTQNLLNACLSAGVEMRPLYAVRTPWEQARMWRQSRAKEQIAAECNRLRNDGGGWLAECIESVGPQNGPRVTGSIPGYSWHNWGEALDCAWIVDGQIEWSTSKQVNGRNGYKVYADLAERMGLTHGLKPGHADEWDWVHVQLRPVSVGKAYTLQQVVKEMMVRYGSDPIESE